MDGEPMSGVGLHPNEHWSSAWIGATPARACAMSPQCVEAFALGTSDSQAQSFSSAGEPPLAAFDYFRSDAVW
jgi:hypothetical protein